MNILNKVAFLIFVVSSVGNAWDLFNPAKLAVGTRHRLRYEDDAALRYTFKKEVFIQSDGRDLTVMTYAANEERSVQEAVNVLNAKISAAKRSKQFLDWTLDASSLTSFVGSLSIDDGSGLGPKKGGSFLELDPLTVTFLPQHKNGELVSLSILSAGKPLLTVDQKTVRGRTDGITLDRIYSELLGKLSISVKQHTSIHFRPSWDGVGLANLFKVGEDDVLYQ